MDVVEFQATIAYSNIFKFGSYEEGKFIQNVEAISSGRRSGNIPN